MGGSLSRKALGQIELSKKTGGTELNLCDCGIQKLAGFNRIVKLKLLVKLDLSRNYLQNVPSKIQRLVNLEELVLSFNEIQKLPSELCSLKNLRVLFLDSNNLTELPESIGNLSATLQVLSIAGNRIKSLPASFRELNLQHLDYSSNGLTVLPPQVFDLTSLKHLSFAGNKLDVPDEITKLSNLESLDISGNDMMALNPIIGNLSRLQVLVMQKNRFTHLPDEVAYLSRLRVLNVENCNLQNLDNLNLSLLTEMEELLFCDNQLDHFPRGVGRMTRLRVLDLSRNRLTKLIHEVGWLDQSIRKLLVGGNQLSAVPGELCFLNPAIELDLNNNPLKAPFVQWYQEGLITLMENLQPFLRAYPPYCYPEDSPDLHSSQAGRPSQFNIQAIDKQKAIRINGGDEIEAHWKGFDATGNPLILKGITKDNQDGTYTVFYNFKHSGKFELHLTESGEPIKGSPIDFYMASGPSDPYQSRVSGEGLAGGVAGQPCTILVHARDQFANHLDHEERVEVEVKGPSGANPKALVQYQGDDEGIYSVSFTAGWPGQYSVTVFIEGQRLECTPVTIPIS
ncbi:LRR receptor-like serine/threonine-protein kinase GSO2 [Balamuthia mandrillaris]